MTPTARHGLALASILATSLLAAPPAAADLGAQPPPGAELAPFHIGGTGCTEADTDVTQDPGKQRLDVRFRALAAEGDGHRTCEVGILVAAPAGVQFALERFQYGGEVDLPSGATATVSSAAYYSGDPQHTSGTPVHFTGEVGGPWAQPGRITPRRYAPRCGGVQEAWLSLRADVRGDDRARVSIGTMSIQLDDFAWRSC